MKPLAGRTLRGFSTSIGPRPTWPAPARHILFPPAGHSGGPMRIAATFFILLSAGCAPTLLRIEPVRAESQDVIYRNGTPVVLSHGTRFEVALQPKAGPTGRYKLDRRLFLIVAIRNLSFRRLDVSEDTFSVTGNGKTARVVRAVEIEDEVNSSTTWSQALNAFAGAMSSMAARSAGVTTYSGQVNGTLLVVVDSMRLNARRSSNFRSAFTLRRSSARTNSAGAL